MTSATADDILELSLKKFKWKTSKQYDRLEELFDDELIFIHITGNVTSKSEWMAELRSGRFAYERIDLKNAAAQIYGDTAVLVGKAKFEVTYHGSKGTFHLIYTEVYTQRNDVWKLVNLHTTSSY